MGTIPATLLALLGAAAAVVAAGTLLARSGDVIAARTRLGGLWVGSIFLAVATSLPELTTDLSAVRLGAPDLAAGDLFGSSLANMLILALLNLAPRADVFRRAALDHVLSAALAILLTSIAAAAILLRPAVTILGVGPGSLVLLAVYLAGTRLIFVGGGLARRAGETAETVAAPPAPEPDAPAGPSLRSAVLRFLAGAAVILVSAPVFAGSAKRLAALTGIDTGFVGTLLLGFTTSLPELVTSAAAMRMGAYDLAVGNLFGSNAVNMVLLVPLDAASPHGPLLGNVETLHVVSALGANALMAVALAAIVSRARGRLSVLEPSSALMALLYVACLAFLFRLGVSP